MKKSLIMITSILLAVMLVISGCGETESAKIAKQAQDATAGSSGETASDSGQTAGVSTEGTTAPGGKGDVVRLNVGLSSAPVNLNIWTNNDLNSSLIGNLMLPNLIYINDEGKKYPYMAESVTSNDAADEFTVKLKEGLVWSDGKPMTAEDLKFTAEYIVEKKLGYAVGMYSIVDSMTIENDTTITYKLKEPDVNFMNQAGFWVPILPKHEFEKVEDPMNHVFSGIGFGPYYLAEEQKGEYVLLKKNPHYTLTDVAVDEIVFRVFSDENAMVLALQNGEVDVTANFISVASQKQLQSKGSFELLPTQSLGYGFISLSQSNEFLQDFNVRQAIAMSVDRQAICNIAYQGGAVPMETPISPVWGDFVKSNIKQPGFDPAAAGDVLEKAGYKDTNGDGVRETADGKPLQFDFAYRNTYPNIDSVMEIMKTGLTEAGIGVKLVPMDASTFSANVTQGHKYDISYSVWGTIDDVDTSLKTIYGIGEMLNFMEYNNQDMEDLLLKSRSETDYNKRVKIIDEWQKLFVQNLPTVNLFVATNTYAANQEKFSGWSVSPGNFGPLGTPNIVNVAPVK